MEFLFQYSTTLILHSIFIYQLKVACFFESDLLYLATQNIWRNYV